MLTSRRCVPDVNAWLGAVLSTLVLTVQSVATEQTTIRNQLEDISRKLGSGPIGAGLLRDHTDGKSLASLLGVPVPLQEMWHLVHMEGMLGQEDVVDAFTREAAFRGGKDVKEAVSRVIDWLLAMPVQRQLNLTGSAFSNGDRVDEAQFTKSEYRGSGLVGFSFL